MRFTLLLLMIFSCASSYAQKRPQISLFDKLYGLDSLKVTLTFPFDSLTKTNTEAIDATISIESESGFLLKNEPVGLTLRGKYRRLKCSFPPLLLNFKKSTLKKLELGNDDEIKLVTHCLEGPEGQSNLQEERMIYQVYEAITPFSYKTIWLNVDYLDEGHPGVSISSAGFLLEPDPVINSRLGIMEKKVYNVVEDSIDYNSYAKVAAFNFMIGNRDWSVVASRNAKLFYDSVQGKYIVIPYDFDYSNVVGASYRRENLTKEMIHPYDRIYVGEYYKDKAGDILKSFYEFRQKITDAVDSSPNPMESQRRKEINKYFYFWFEMVKHHKPSLMPYGTICPYKGGL